MTLHKIYTKQIGYFPAAGHWCLSDLRPEDNFYQPHYCSLDNNLFPLTSQGRSVKGEAFVKCFKRKNWNYITIVGDSHASRIADAFVGIVTYLGGNCTVFKKDNASEDFKVDKAYFRKNNIDINKIDAGSRACLTCINRAFNCKLNDHSFTLEQLAMSDVLDTSVRYQFGKYGQQHPSVTTQEFVLRHYFSIDFPDLLIWAPPFAHAVNLGRNNFKKIALDTAYLVSLVEHYLPSDSSVIWIPVPRVWKGDKNKFKSYDGYSANTHLHMMNKGLFESIKNELYNMSSERTTSYLDTIALSAPLANYTDHVHYDPFYYMSMMKYLMQIKCLK